MNKINKKNKNEMKDVRYSRPLFVYEKWGRKLVKDGILDIGCFRSPMRNYYTNYIGIDLEGKPDFKVNLEKEKIPFKLNSFQLVICLDVLEHLDNMHDVLDQIVEISREYIILSFPNELRWKSLYKFLTKTNDREFGFRPTNRHKWFLSYTQSRDFIYNYAKQKNLVIYDEFVELGSISKILHKLLNFKFPNLMPYRYFVVLKKD